MKIGFTFTNYNNSRLSIQAAQSIAANHGDCDYEIVLVDNASTDEERMILSPSGALPVHCTVLWNPYNVGYFDGLNLGMAALLKRASQYDAIVIGNNDLVFEPEFFEGLKRHTDVLAKQSVVSPNIITLDNQHQNPHVIAGVSRLREFVWDLYFSNFMLSQLIGWAAQRARSLVSRKDHCAHAIEGAIYQGYGACYILTPNFFRKYKRLWSPGFLMGEEFYLARQLAAEGEQMYYVPDIPVRHHDHATVSKLPSLRLWEMTRQYHRIYRFFISPYRWSMDSGKTPADFDLSQGSPKTNVNS
ncbi:glycosyltransferase [Pseudomonas sp. LS44]|uniref:glycosyltransferase family 2 protein n=1 Tax=Pseudomonas sp. LS44 TaxID=1357074 RepID=UPI00215AFE0E|nr:glycosyltransferase [Pseudomonas sp. LS44]UVE19038.1 glycosyltransferase [Pseudomonas sp. LS44]